MCFSMYTQYQPRPVTDDVESGTVQRPTGAPPTKAELDENLFGPKPTPPEWQTPAASDNGNGQHAHTVETPEATVVATNGSGGNAIASVNTQTVEAVVVELANGTKLLICPL